MSSEERNLFRYAGDEAEANETAAAAQAAAEHQAYLTAQAAAQAAHGGGGGGGGGPSNYAQTMEDEAAYRQHHQQYPEDVASAAVRAVPPPSAFHHMAQSLGGGSQLDDDDEQTDKKGKGKRQRVHYSCTECHRRKQKCDRKTPCQHCIARKVPERCKTFQPGEETDEMAQRLNRLERNVEEGFARLTQLIEANIVGAAAGQVMHASASQQQQSAAVYAANPSYQQSILPPPPNAMQARYTGVPGPASEGDDVVNDGGQLSPKTGTFAASGATDMRVDTLLDKLSGHPGTTKDPYRAPEFMNIDEAMSEYGATLSISYSLVAALPPRHLAEALLNHWYDDVNWIRVPIEQKRLRKDFDDLWASGPSLTTGNLNTYAVLVLILALATLSFPRSEAFPENPRLVRLTARRLHFAGRRALLVSAMLGRQDIDNVIAWTLSGRYCIMDSRISEGWNSTVNAVSAAWVVGLHRDGAQLGLSPEVSEVRRQVWGMVFWLERALAMNLGRPTMLNSDICDVQIPDDRHGYEDYLPKSMEGILVPGLPRGVAQPTILTYSQYRHELCVFVGRLINSYQNLQSPAHYSDILAIEADLETFTKNLPSYFQSTVNESSTLGEERPLDTSSPLWLVVHRYSLTSDINYMRGALHRPYLLRSHGGKAGARFMPSRRAAIAAAHHDILSRHDFVRTIRAHFAPNKVPMGYHLHLGSQKYFSACLTLGIAALMDPHADDALVWRAHLQAYLERAKLKAGSLAADASQREARIIELFLARIDDMRAGKQAPYQGRKRGREAGQSEDSTGSTRRSGKSRRTVEEEGDAHATAGLLLGLGRGDERSSQLSYSQLAGMSGSTTSPGSTTTPSASHNASADEAQQLFEHWYRTEFAAGGSVSESVFTDHMDSGGLAGFDKLVSTSVSGLPPLPNAPMASASGIPLPPPAHGHGVASSSGAYATGAQVALSDIAATNSIAPSGGGVHYGTLQTPAWGNAPSDGTNANFDPAFWENLMDKISSTRTAR